MGRFVADGQARHRAASGGALEELAQQQAAAVIDEYRNRMKTASLLRRRYLWLRMRLDVAHARREAMGDDSLY